MSVSPGPGAEAPIGEVTVAATTRFQAVSHEVFEPPRFGSFVRVGRNGGAVYGVVAHVQTASFDAQRRPVAFGMPWDELVREQPQLVELLQTGFDTAVIGFGDERGLHHYLPPYPPRVHDAVFACDPTEVAALTDSMEFVRTLASLDQKQTHELVAAAIREASLARGRDESFLAQAARAVSDLFKDDYDVAMAIVRRLA
jgi:hypothetical protein